MHLIWQLSYINYTENDPASRYDNSRIRATLNGRSDVPPVTDDYANWETCLESDNCLFSCLPSDLQSAIKAKHIKVPTQWSTNGPDYSIDDTKSVDIQDKLWLTNANELWDHPLKYDEDYGKCFSKYQNKLSGYRISYKEDKAGRSRWLRSPNRNFLYHAGDVNNNGDRSDNYVNYYYYELSPCFCL